MNESNQQLLEEVYNQFPLRIEDYVTLFGRTTMVKQFMRNYLKHSPIGAGQRVAVIAHGSFLKCMTAEGVDPVRRELIGGADMKNCQIFPFP